MISSRLRFLGLPFLSCIFMSVYLYNLHKLALTRVSQDDAYLEDKITPISNTRNNKFSQLFGSVSNTNNSEIKMGIVEIEDLKHRRNILKNIMTMSDDVRSGKDISAERNVKIVNHNSQNERGENPRNQINLNITNQKNLRTKLPIHDTFPQNVSLKEYAIEQSNNSNIFNTALTPHEKDILFEILKKFVQICNDNNFTYFVSGGTLLGSFRHHDIIPWDDDIDVYVHRIQKDDLYFALYSLEPHFSAYPSGPRIKFYSRDSQKLNKYKWRWPYIDINFYDNNSTHVYDISPDYSYLSFPLDTMFPLHLRPFGDLFVNSPRDSYAHLRRMYRTTNCVQDGYSHKHEVADGKHKFLDCEKLKNLVPFVHRSPTNGGVIETLKLGDEVIHTLKVHEPEYVVTKPYVLELM